MQVGTLVGVDYTPAMLEQAEKQVLRMGWQNVHLLQGDAAQISLDRRFDAALSTLAMSVIPDYPQALRNMARHVASGGRIAVADAKNSQRWYARPLNRVSTLLGWGAAASLAREPWKVVEGLVADCFYKEWFIGFFYAAGGKVF